MGVDMWATRNGEFYDLTQADFDLFCRAQIRLPSFRPNVITGRSVLETVKVGCGVDPWDWLNETIEPDEVKIMLSRLKIYLPDSTDIDTRYIKQELIKFLEICAANGFGLYFGH